MPPFTLLPTALSKLVNDEERIYRYEFVLFFLFGSWCLVSLKI